MSFLIRWDGVMSFAPGLGHHLPVPPYHLSYSIVSFLFLAHQFFIRILLSH